MATSVKLDVLSQHIKVYDMVASEKKIYSDTKKITNSQGAAIDGINNCLKEFDAYCRAINDLYGAIVTYLHTAASNYAKCENDNENKSKYRG